MQRTAGIREGEIFHVPTIEQKLAEFNAFTDLRARLNISPGKAEGSSDIELVTQEHKRFGATLFADNAGQHSTGYYRGGAFVTARGLVSTAYTRDILTAGYVGSEGADSFSGSYAITENEYKTTWSVSLDHSDTDVVTRELRDLDVEGTFTACTLAGKRALVSGGGHVLSGAVQFAFKENESSVLSYKMNAYRTNTLAFVLDDLLFLDHGYLYNSLSLVRGWQLTENSRDFWRLAYRAEGNYAFNKYIGFNGRFIAQISNRHDLQSSEQIQLGGGNTVRGYEEGLVNGERGYALQAELRTNLASLWKATPAWLDSAEAFAFFDCGQQSHKTESAELSNQNSTFLSSIGGGLRVGLWQHLNATGTIAMPLKKHQYNLRDNKPHFLFAVGAEFKLGAGMSGGYPGGGPGGQPWRIGELLVRGFLLALAGKIL